MGKTVLTMHGFQGAPFSFLWIYFIFCLFIFLFCFVLIIFPLISVFWPHPGESSAFDFSLYGYMVNFLSHSSEMETFLKKLCTIIILHCSSCCLLFIAESEARLKRWQLLGFFRVLENSKLNGLGIVFKLKSKLHNKNNSVSKLPANWIITG